MRALAALLFCILWLLVEDVNSFCASTPLPSRWSTTSARRLVSIHILRANDNKDAASVSLRQRKKTNSVVARRVIPQNVTLQILHEDAYMLVIDKPAGMVVQFASGSVENAAVHHFNSTSATRYESSSWPWKASDSFEGIVHRLDKGTSGILVLAKHPSAARSLQTSFEERRVHKTYLAIAVGLPNEETILSSVTTKKQTTPDQGDSKPPVVLTPHQRRLSKQIKECGRQVDAALVLLRESSDPSPSCFSAAISVCLRAGNRDAALAVFESMSSQNVTPNLECFKTTLKLCAKDPPLYKEALELVDFMEECHLPLHPHCVSAAISACGRAGQLEPALALLRRMEQPRGGRSNDDMEVCLKAAMGACHRCGATHEARELADRLQRLHANPASPFEAFASTDPAREKVFRNNQGIVVNAPIGKKGSRRMGVVPTSNGGRNALSVVTPLAFDGTLSLNRVVIETGRTHQIRVHLAALLKCPIVGDRVYGCRASAKLAKRTMLHAQQLLVPHPATDEILKLQCPPPSDFDSLAQEIIQNNVLSYE